ncbi:MAG: response regulator transcription factor [Vulcanimicrobiaceae bacterium]
MTVKRQTPEGVKRSLFALAYRRYAELPHGLTERRLQVLRGVCAGKTSEQVATDLGLSESTVRKHIGDLHRILGVTRRAELVRRALELKLVA